MDIPSLLISILPSNLFVRIRSFLVSNFKIEILVCEEEPPPGCSFLFLRQIERELSVGCGCPNHNACLLIHFKVIGRSWKNLAIRNIAVDVLLDNHWRETSRYFYYSFQGDVCSLSLHQDMLDLQKESVNIQPAEERTFRVAYSFKTTRLLNEAKIRLKIRDSDNRSSETKEVIPRHSQY